MNEVTLLLTVDGIGFLVSAIYALVALVAGLGIGKYERQTNSATARPIISMLRLAMFEPLITSSIVGLLLTVYTIIQDPIIVGGIGVVAMVIQLIILPGRWFSSADSAERQISRKLIVLGIWRIVGAVVSAASFGVLMIIGIVILAISIKSTKKLAIAHGISLSAAPGAGSYYQAITMGEDGIMVQKRQQG